MVGFRLQKNVTFCKFFCGLLGRDDLHGLEVVVLTFILVFVGYGEASFRKEAAVLVGSEGT